HPRDFLVPDFRAAVATDNGMRRTPSSLREHLVHDLTVASLPALVHHEDRMSMAFSREIRLPFLDPRLVELAVRMPSSLKIRNGVTKYVLRQAMEGEGVPPAILNRHDKKGYPTPVGKWFRTIANDETRALLSSASFVQRGIVDAKKAQAAFASHVKGVADFTLLLWQW